MTDLLDLLLDRATVVAPRLLGSVLAATNTAGESVGIRITEVEAYEGVGDPGSHAYRGMTPRTRPMFGAPPQVYVYLSYGIHSCLNIVCAPEGEGQGCLIRAGEVVWGEELMPQRRPKARTPRDWARGPGNVGSALGVTVPDSGHALDLQRLPTGWGSALPGNEDAFELFAPRSRLTLYLPDDRVADANIGRSGRIGVSGPGGDGEKFPWRFFLRDEKSVSRHPKK